MKKDLDILLDKCIDRMNQGFSLEECLASYPEQTKELEPLLRAVWNARDACSPIPRVTAKSLARRQLNAALATSDSRLQERGQRTVPWFGWSKAWAPVAIALVLALISAGLYWIFLPAASPPVVAQANSRLLLSDQENAIGDFEKLEVTITRIGMLRRGDEISWQEIALDPGVVVDLTRLEGLNAQEIWGGIIPEGQYLKVFIYIEDAIGTLKNGETVDVFVPSGNLHISKPFVVGAGDSVVNFVYDVTVVHAGKKYILLPQLDQSGPEQQFHEVGEGALTLWVVDPVPPTPVTPGETITIIVTLEGNPVEGAQVRVEDVGAFVTPDDGRISFTVPYDDELEVKVKKDKLEEELEIDLEEEDEETEGEETEREEAEEERPDKD